MVPLKVESDGTTKLAVAPTYTDASSETAEA
jgi:hypothetical protein